MTSNNKILVFLITSCCLLLGLNKIPQSPKFQLEISFDKVKLSKKKLEVERDSLSIFSLDTNGFKQKFEVDFNNWHKKDIYKISINNYLLKFDSLNFYMFSLDGFQNINMVEMLDLGNKNEFCNKLNYSTKEYLSIIISNKPIKNIEEILLGLEFTTGNIENRINGTFGIKNIINDEIEINTQLNKSNNCLKVIIDECFFSKDTVKIFPIIFEFDVVSEQLFSKGKLNKRKII